MRRRSEFTAAVRRGRRVSTPALTLHVLPAASPGLPPSPRLQGEHVAVDVPHIGFIVARAVGPAVVRNTVRRRLRHLLRDRLAILTPARSLVVRVSPAAASLRSRDLAAALDAALARAFPAHQQGRSAP